MTWRQAVNLGWNGGGVTPVDALLPSDEFSDAKTSDAKACKALGKTVTSMIDQSTMQFKETCKGIHSQYPGVTQDDDNECLYTTGPDKRSIATPHPDGGITTENTDWSAMAGALISTFKSGQFPAYKVRYDIITRLMWFYMADANHQGEFRKIAKTMKNKKSDHPLIYLASSDIIPPETAKWASAKAARVVALAAAVPCLARSEARKDDPKKIKDYAKNMGMSDDKQIPSFIDCGIVRMLAEE